jgi:Sec-independent protein translocase protein TatA
MYPHNPIAILLLFVVVVLLFGSQKIPELMRGEQDSELRKDQEREAEIRRRVEEEMRREDEKRHASK